MKVLTTPRSYGKTDPAVFEMLEKAGLEVIRNETGGILDREAMKRLLADCEGVIVGVDPLDAQVMAAAPRLRAIAKYGVGVDNIDLEAARARGIKVSRTVGANAEAVADYAMTLMLAVARRAAQLHGGTVIARCVPGQGLRAVASIPLGEAGEGLLREPGTGWDRGGFDDELVALSKLLPAWVFRPESGGEGDGE